MAITPNDLTAALSGREGLFSLLKDHLNWPLDAEDPFTYDEPESVAGRAAAKLRLSRLVDFSAGDPFVIFLVEFQSEFRRGHLREVLRGVRQRIRREAAYRTADLDELIFVCRVPDGLRFVHFEEKENRQPRMRVFGFDADTVNETYTLRSVNLPALKLTLNLLNEVDWSACKKNWMEAWSVEKVTRDFFKDYKRIFDDVRENHINGVVGNKQLYTQRLFNRLMFIHFLSKKGRKEKKGWLNFGERKDYLFALRDAAKSANENLFKDRLYWTFFNGLGVFVSPENQNDAFLVERRGEVPYLNGGLFEMVDDGTNDDTRDQVTIDNEAFDKILDGLFGCYNFTVSESTPDDQEVAVDPEMLGKVFEELVTGRHESGSYYTPRPIVQFMCREALKGYLADCGAGITELVDLHDADGVSDPEAVLAALKTVRVVDPACGSGAYLLGMLQELVAIRQALFVSKKVDSETLYNRKLEIIQNSLYGVDLDPFAVNTARLRLWLSLVVDDTRNPFVPDKKTGKLPQVALPNLDFKIEIGDSVSSPDPSQLPKQINTRAELIRQFDKKKREYGDVHYKGDKSALKKEIAILRGEIADETPGGNTAFDWRVDFGEVFQEEHPFADIGGKLNMGGTLTEPPKPGGFDIVLANPPYVRGELITALKPVLKKVYGDLFGGTMDLYCFFYYRAIQLLKDGGQLVFITPNKWFRAGYGSKLREYIATQCRVRSITDFGELPVFEAAATFPMIFAAQKGQEYKGTSTFTQVKNLNPPYPDVKQVIAASGFTLPEEAIIGKDWSLTDSHVSDRLKTMERAGIPLEKYVNGKIYYGIKTGFNTAFVIDEAKRAELIAANPKSVELIKPLAVGDDIRRWRLANQEQKRKYLIVTKVGVPIAQYPAVYKHLCQWKTELQKRVDKGNQWWELRACAYYDSFDEPKIVFPIIGKEPRFAFDLYGTFTNDKSYIIPLNDLFLAGVLNSSSAWEFFKRTCSSIGDEDNGGRLELRAIYVKKLPIPNANDSDKAAITTLVQQCLDKRGQNVEQEEAEINARVAALYGL